MGDNSITLASGTNLTIAAFNGAAGSVTPASLTLNANTSISLFKTGGAGGFSPALNSPTTVGGGLITFNASPDFGGIPNGLLQSSTVTLGPTTFNGDTTIQTIAGGSSSAATGVTFGAIGDNGHTLIFLGQGNNVGGFGPGSGTTINGVINDSTVTATGNWIIGDVAGSNAQILTLNAQHVTHPEFALTTGNVTVNPGSQLNIASLSTTAVYGPQSGTQTITLNGQGPVDLAHPGQFLGALFVASRAQPIFNTNVNLVLAGSTLINIDNSNALIATEAIFNGPVTGAGALTLKAGDTEGRLIFNGANNLTGSTTITAGKLQVNLGSSMGTGDLTLAQAGGQNTDLILNNVGQSIGNLRSLYAGSATGPVFQEIHLHGAALSITQTVNADYGIDPADGATPTGSSSIISGTGSIILSNASTAELSLSDPNNSFSGSTTINGGSLAVSADSNLGSVPVSSTPGQLTVNGGQFHAKGGAPVALAATRGFAVGPNGGTLQTDAATPLTIAGATTFSNSAATLTVAGNSYVKFNSTANATAVASGASVTVASGATLELAGSASALSDGVSGNANVVNNSQAAGGGLLATGANQKVGFISGTGNTLVDAGSDLTAGGVIQNSLVIGGTAGNPATLTIRASDDGSVMLADESAGGADGSSLSLISSTAAEKPFAVGLVSGSNSLDGAAKLDKSNISGGASLGFTGGSMTVPEPSTLLLLGMGLAGLAGASLRRLNPSRGGGRGWIRG
jgi:autotransporter-associated beta strand protein